MTQAAAGLRHVELAGGAGLDSHGPSSHSLQGLVPIPSTLQPFAKLHIDAVKHICKLHAFLLLQSQSVSKAKGDL